MNNKLLLSSGLCLALLMLLGGGLALAGDDRLQTGDDRLQTGDSVVPGPSGTVFRYEQTFGEAGVPYLVDTDHLYLPAGVGTDAAGNLWVAEELGSRILKYSGPGTFLLSLGTPGSSWLADETHIADPNDIGMDRAGNFWVVDNAAYRVVKFDQAGNYLMQIGVTWESGSDNAHFNEPAGLAIDSGGSLYVSDFYNHRIQVFDSSGTYSLTIGTGAPGAGNDQFNHPLRIAIDDADNLYVADSQNHRVQIFDASHTYVATLGESGVPGGDNGHFSGPGGVAVDASFIYVADSDNNRVQIFDRAAPYAYQETLGSYGRGDYQFVYPRDLALDPAGNLYVADMFNQRVQKYDGSLAYARTFGVTGVPYLTDDSHYNQPGKVAVDANGNLGILEDEGRGQRFIKLDASGAPLFSLGEAGVRGGDDDHFNDPRGLAFDAAGNIYIGDCANHRVQIFTGSGVYSQTLGSYGQGEAQFDCPAGVAFDGSGNFYVADSGNQRIQIFDSSLVYSATLGETGVPGADNGHFNLPQDVAVDAEGDIFVADTFNNRVQVFDRDLAWRMTLGVTGECSNDFDYLCEPYGVAVDAAGNIYVAENAGNRVQVFDASGAYLTTIGGVWGDLSSQFRNVRGVAVDSAGNVYSTDLLNHRVQKFAPGVPDWQQVNLNGFGERFAMGVTALEAFDGQLYAGTSTSWTPAVEGPQIYRTADGVTWSAASEPGFGVYTDTVGTIIDLAVFDGQLYAGAGWGDFKPGQIWRTADGATWEAVTTDGFGNWHNNSITAFTEFNDMFYAGTGNLAGGAQIWRSASGNAGDWNVVAPDESGTQDTTNVTGLAVYKGALYAAVEANGAIRGSAQVWRAASGATWSTVVADGFGDAGNFSTGGFAVYGGYLYLGTQNDTTGAQLWRSADGMNWKQAIGDGFGDVQNSKIEMLFAFAGQLYAGVDNRVTGLKILRSSDGVNWKQVNLDGFGDNNTEANLWNNSVTRFHNHLHIGTWNWASGGEIWRYDLLERLSFLPAIQK